MRPSILAFVLVATCGDDRPNPAADSRPPDVGVLADASDGASEGEDVLAGSGEIVLAHSDSNMVPVASIVIEDGYSYVFVLGDDQQTVHRCRVETGIVNGNLIEILSGVMPGERVVDKGAGFLKDGDRVNVVADDVERPS